MPSNPEAQIYICSPQITLLNCRYIYHMCNSLLDSSAWPVPWILQSCEVQIRTHRSSETPEMPPSLLVLSDLNYHPCSCSSQVLGVILDSSFYPAHTHCAVSCPSAQAIPDSPLGKPHLYPFLIWERIILLKCRSHVTFLIYTL